ncbi:MAG: hypothetical protein HOP09_08645 [Hyphomicrobium sp.]|nr:hypothetical protein [Hyphomicrobium sp.]
MNLAEDAAKLWPSFQWRYLLLLPVAAGIVHLIATFLAMNDTRASAYQKLSAVLPANTMKVLPPVKPGQQPLPFLGADAHYAMCSFSSKQGPVDVNALLPDRGWSLGVYNPDGSTVYFASGATGKPITVALTILPGDDRFLGLTPQALGKPAATAAQLTLNARRGLIVVRAPDRGAAYRQGDEAILAKAKCAATPF